MSAESYTLFKLIELHGGLIQTGPFGSQLHQHEYVESGVPVVMPKDIADGRVNDAGIAMVSENKANALARHKLKKGDIVFPRRGDIRKCALIGEDQDGYLCGTGCLKITLPKQVYSPHFLYYYLVLPKVGEWLERNAVGTTMLNLNTSILGGVSIPDKSIDEQNEIVSILSAYDDLIENNRRRIQLLEASARLLYKEWFVRLRFPGHEHVTVVDGVPEKKTLGEVAPLSYGKALKKELRIPGPFPVYGSSGYVGSHNKPLVKGPGIILGRKGNFGSVFWSSKDFFPIDTVYFLPNEKANLYLYYVLMHMSFISTDVAVPGLNRDFAHSRKLLIPDDKIMMLFDEQVISIHSQIDCLNDYNTSLAQARDLLLPRLMNGEVAV